MLFASFYKYSTPNFSSGKVPSSTPNTARKSVLLPKIQELGTRVMYHRPNDPNKFLLEVLGTLETARDQGMPVRSLLHFSVCRPSI